MSEEDKTKLAYELETAIHEHSHVSPSGNVDYIEIVEPTSLKELLAHMIELITKEGG